MGQHRSAVAATGGPDKQPRRGGEDGRHSGAGSFWQNRRRAIAIAPSYWSGATGRGRRQIAGAETGRDRCVKQFWRDVGPVAGIAGGLSGLEIESELFEVAG